jgi:hypothetical protein
MTEPEQVISFRSLALACHPVGGGCWVRTNVGVSRQVYSLLPLTTRATHQVCAVRRPASLSETGPTDAPLYAGLSLVMRRAGEGSRTPNLLFTKQVLCRLSYASASTARSSAWPPNWERRPGGLCEPLFVARRASFPPGSSGHDSLPARGSLANRLVREGRAGVGSPGPQGCQARFIPNRMG